MASSQPKATRVYQNHHLDSTRWERFQPRDDDIVVSTSYKCGTTWMQMIVRQLLFEDTDGLDPLMTLSPWIDARFQAPLDELIDRLESQSHRRSVKTHLPLDGLPFYDQLKYIVVGRDARDVFMSLWNHYSNYTPWLYDHFLEIPGMNGEPYPVCPSDIRDFYRQWINRGWFEWESEGYPFWSNMWHTQSWWDHRDQPNILFVHYNDLSSDLKGEIKIVAEFLDIEVSDQRLDAIVESVTFKNMKENAEEIVPEVGKAFEGGPQTFINKGTNGRWIGVLNDDDLEMHEAAVKRVLTPDSARWLEHGRLAAGANI